MAPCAEALGVPTFSVLCGTGGVTFGFLVCLVAFMLGFCGFFCLQGFFLQSYVLEVSLTTAFELVCQGWRAGWLLHGPAHAAIWPSWSSRLLRALPEVRQLDFLGAVRLEDVGP